MSREVRDNVERILGNDFTEKIGANLSQNNLDAAKANLDAAYIVSPRIFDDVQNRIKKQTDMRLSPENKQQLLMYTPGNVPLLNK